jgi:hypothetical protein
MNRLCSWHYTEVPRLGEDGGSATVIISPDALQQLRCASVDDAELSETLAKGVDVRARTASYMVGREYAGVRLVLKTWPGLPGSAAVCVNGYRVTK